MVLAWLAACSGFLGFGDDPVVTDVVDVTDDPTTVPTGEWNPFFSLDCAVDPDLAVAEYNMVVTGLPPADAGAEWKLGRIEIFCDTCSTPLEKHDLSEGNLDAETGHVTATFPIVEASATAGQTTWDCRLEGQPGFAVLYTAWLVDDDFLDSCVYYGVGVSVEEIQARLGDEVCTGSTLLIGL